MRSDSVFRVRPTSMALAMLASGCFLAPAVIATAQAQDQVRPPTVTPSEVPAPVSVRYMTPRFENLNMEDGLSQSSVYDILQDSRGFIWFVTQAGLNRWDGYEMKVYTHEPFDENSLGASWGWRVSEGNDGSIWVGTQGGGLSRVDPVTDGVTVYQHDPEDSTSISSDRIFGSLEDREGILWVAANPGGVNRMNPDRPGFFIRYQHDPEDSTSVSSNFVNNVFEDSSGRLWFSTGRGLNRIDAAKQGRFEHFLDLEDEGLFGEGHAVFGIVERPEEPGILWVGTEYGLIRLDTKSGDFDRFVPNPDERRLNTIYDPSQDPLNPSILWVPIYNGGLARFDIRSRSYVKYVHDPRNPTSLSGNIAMSTLVDRSGMVWVGTELTGVDRFNPASVGFQHLRAEVGNPNSLPGSNVWSVTQTRDGHLWVGSEGPDGPVLSEFDRQRGEARHFEYSRSDPYSISRGRSQSLLEDRAATLWIGTESGLDWLDRSSGRFYHYQHDANNEASIRRGSIWSLFEDHSGNLWVGTTTGLSRLGPNRDGRFEHFDLGVRLGENGDIVFVFDVTEDPAGFIWVGTAGGVVRLNPDNGETTRYDHNPGDPESLSDRWAQSVVIRNREPGVVWVATGEGGLNRLDTSTGKFRHWLKRDGLADNVIYSMLEDGEGRLWMGTNHGLSRFDPETETFRNYGLEIGLQSLEFTQAAAHIGTFGEMFFGGTGGLNAFFPNELNENINPPEVTLVDLKLFNESVRGAGVVDLDVPLHEAGEIIFDHTERDLTFDFVALHFADSKNNKYAYRLDGFNDDWVSAGRNRSAQYTNLPPGAYSFMVKAANSDGVWSDPIELARVRITPPFWATWWFRIAAFLFFGAVLYGGFRLRTQQLADRARTLEETVEERTAELRESNAQLEQSHAIVEAINQETSFRRLLTRIMEQSRVIPGVEKATALVYSSDGFFQVRASSGWDVAQMQHIRLSPGEAHRRYVEQSEEVAEDIFVAKNAAERTAADQLAEFGKVASFLVLRIRVEGQVAGYLVFDNLHDEDAFDSRDVALLERLREHIQSAFIKTRILEDLQNTLNNLRTTQDRLVQSEKMASLGQLTAGIAHEIKNPLNFVNNFSDVTTELAQEIAEEFSGFKAALPQDKAKEFDGLLESLVLNARKIAEHGKRADGIVQNMLEHSKIGEGQHAPTDLNEFLDEYVTLAHHGLRAKEGEFDVAIQRQFDPNVNKVDLIPQDMGRVFMNLIGNAFDALRSHGASDGSPMLIVSTERTEDGVVVRVIDNGPGIPDNMRQKIFEPFFTTKPTGSGTGLGLSMSYDIVTKGHGGTLEVRSEEGKGSTFIVRLPV